MTIKTQGGKVITKDGKVSCECCEELFGCCIYPAQALAGGEYSASDLPDAVTVEGVSFNRSGTGYGDTTNGVILEGNVWAKYRNGVRSARQCLIQGGVVDQFADTYTASGNPDYDQIIERQSLGIWQGPGNPSGEETEISVFYMRCIEDEALREEYPDDQDAWFMGIGPESVAKKSGDQNTPVGSYSFGGVAGTMTVS